MRDSVLSRPSQAHVRVSGGRVVLRAALRGEQADILRGRVRREAVQVVDLVQDRGRAARYRLAAAGARLLVAIVGRCAARGRALRPRAAASCSVVLASSMVTR